MADIVSTKLTAVPGRNFDNLHLDPRVFLSAKNLLEIWGVGGDRNTAYPQGLGEGVDRPKTFTVPCPWVSGSQGLGKDSLPLQALVPTSLL
jgi:hypothetical protein